MSVHNPEFLGLRLVKFVGELSKPKVYYNEDKTSSMVKGKPYSR